MKCTQRLYLTADKKKLVAEGDKKAAALYAVPGDEIPQSAADAFGLVEGHLKGFDPDAGAQAADETGEKDGKAGQDKEQKGGSDKEQQPDGDKESAGQAGASGENA